VSKRVGLKNLSQRMNAKYCRAALPPTPSVASSCR
jgi:hypothetical protein